MMINIFAKIKKNHKERKLRKRIINSAYFLYSICNRRYEDKHIVIYCPSYYFCTIWEKINNEKIIVFNKDISEKSLTWTSVLLFRKGCWIEHLFSATEKNKLEVLENKKIENKINFLDINDCHLFPDLFQK